MWGSLVFNARLLCSASVLLNFRGTTYELELSRLCFLGGHKHPPPQRSTARDIYTRYEKMYLHAASPSSSSTFQVQWNSRRCCFVYFLVLMVLIARNPRYSMLRFWDERHHASQSQQLHCSTSSSAAPEYYLVGINSVGTIAWQMQWWCIFFCEFDTRSRSVVWVGRHWLVDCIGANCPTDWAFYLVGTLV